MLSRGALDPSEYMPASLEELIQNKVRKLADEQQQEVLEFVESLEELAQAPDSQQDIDLRSLGVTKRQAFELRASLTTFEDWTAPEMDIYDEYDQNFASRNKKI